MQHAHRRQYNLELPTDPTSNSQLTWRFHPPPPRNLNLPQRQTDRPRPARPARPARPVRCHSTAQAQQPAMWWMPVASGHPRCRSGGGHFRARPTHGRTGSQRWPLAESPDQSHRPSPATCAVCCGGFAAPPDSRNGCSRRLPAPALPPPTATRPHPTTPAPTATAKPLRPQPDRTVRRRVW